MQQLITGLLLVVLIPLNMFRASLCPSSGTYQLQLQPLVYCRNVMVAVLLAVVGPAGRTDHGQQHCYYHVPTINQRYTLLSEELDSGGSIKLLQNLKKESQKMSATLWL
jgi:hypothetical protein